MPTFKIQVKPDENPVWIKADDFDAAEAQAEQMHHFDVPLPGEGTIRIRGTDADNAADNAKAYLRDLPGTYESEAKQGGAALLRGGANLVGLPGTIRDLTGSGIAKGLSWATGSDIKPEDLSLSNLAEKGVEKATGYKIDKGSLTDKILQNITLERGLHALPNIGDTRKFTSDMTGGFSERQPRNTTEEYIRTGGEFLPAVAAAAFTGGASLPALAFDATVPALTSETLGQGARKAANYLGRPGWVPNWVPEAETVARVAGGLPSSGVVQKVITPNTIPQRLQRAVEDFRSRNIPYDAAQQSESWQRGGGQDLSHMLPEQHEGFNAAANETVGVGPGLHQHATLEDATNAIRNDYNNIARNYDTTIDQPLQTAVRRIFRDYHNNVKNPNPLDMRSGWDNGLKNTYDSILSDFGQTGTIPGGRFQNYIEDLRNIAQNGSDSASQNAAIQLRRALERGMEREIQRAPNGAADLQAFRTMSGRYRDAMTLEDAQAASTTGNNMFTPDQLAAAVKRHAGKRAFVNDTTDLGVLAKSGQQMMKKLPGASGQTLSDSLAGAAIKVGRKASIPGLLGILADQAFGPLIGKITGPATAVVTGLAEHGIGKSLKALRNSPVGQAYLKNQLVPNTPMNASKMLRSNLPGLSIYGDQQADQQEQ